MPSMVIFDRQSVPGTMYGLSSKGWIDTVLFELWFTHHFLAYAPPARPLLLLLDGHSSHFQQVFVKRAAKEQVIVFCLPPHTTHQPLDKGCFGPLKMFWRQEYLLSHPGKVVTRFQFSQLFSRAWFWGMSLSNVTTGFCITGVFPFDRYVLRPAHNQPKPNSLAEKTGLNYIPLFSPARPPSQHSHPPTSTVSTEKILRYQRRFDEGYDLDIDRWYTDWKQIYHPENENPAPATPHIVSPHLQLYSPLSPTTFPIPGRLNLVDEQHQSQQQDRNQDHQSNVACLGRCKVLSKPLNARPETTNHPAKDIRMGVNQQGELENIGRQSETKG